jgi:acyl-CoA dehydrogenase
MPWDFSTEPEFQAKLDWATEFVRERVQPLDILYPSTTSCDPSWIR